MLVHGRTRNPMITGSSVHNQRIERLWRDTYRCVLSVYYQLFHYLEDQDLIDPTSEIDLFCVHIVYEDRINQSLKSFVDGWNNHGLSSEHNMTPIQLFVSSVVRQGFDRDRETDVSEADSTMGEFDVQGVEVPSTYNPLSPDQLRELRRLVMIQYESDTDYGIQTFIVVKDFVKRTVLSTV